MSELRGGARAGIAGTEASLDGLILSSPFTMLFLDKVRNTRRAWANESTKYLAFCAITFAWGDLLFGVDTGSFGSIQALPAFLNSFAPLNAKGVRAFPTEDKSIMNSLVWPGKLIGTIAFEPLVERVGYKWSMYVVALIQTIALIVQLTAKSWQVFAGGRVIAYFGVGIVENVVPSYLAEIAPASLRGFFAGIMNIVVALGNLWGSGMGRAYATEEHKRGWLIPVAVQFIPVLMMVALVPFTPESPRYLVMHGKSEQALKGLNKIRPKLDVDNGHTVLEVELLEAAIHEASSQDSGRWVELVTKPYYRQHFIGFMVFLMNQCTGNQFINLYGPTFFKSIGLGARSFTYNTIILAVGICASIVSVCIVDFTGRRPLYFLGLSLAAIFSAVSGGVGSKKSFSGTDTNVIIASLTFMMIGCKIAANPYCYVIAGEIGGVRMRKKIMAVSTAWDVVFAFAMSFGIPYLITDISAKVGFFFMGISILSLIWTILYLPELTGRSLEEVDELFAARPKLWGWQFEHYVTSGAGSRLTRLEHGEVVDKPYAAQGEPGKDATESAERSV